MIKVNLEVASYGIQLFRLNVNRGGPISLLFLSLHMRIRSADIVAAATTVTYASTAVDEANDDTSSMLLGLTFSSLGR